MSEDLKPNREMPLRIKVLVYSLFAVVIVLLFFKALHRLDESATKTEDFNQAAAAQVEEDPLVKINKSLAVLRQELPVLRENVPKLHDEQLPDVYATVDEFKEALREVQTELDLLKEQEANSKPPQE